MFLRNRGASGRFTFDEVYSALQKAMRRGDLDLSLEMVKEFRDYPNALKKRLVYCCCEDCPNLYLIRDIYGTKADISELIKFVPVICNHVKCREVIMTFRAACQEEKDEREFDVRKDDVMGMCRKIFTRLCRNGNDVNSVLEELVGVIGGELSDKKKWKLVTISNFINKCRTVLFAVVAWLKIGYVTVKNYKDVFIGPHILSEEKIGEVLKFKFDERFNKLPLWVYDKHVKNAPENQKGYKFFIENIVLVPRMPKTYWEKRGEELYIQTNKASGEYIVNEEKEMKGKKSTKKKNVEYNIEFVEEAKSTPPWNINQALPTKNNYTSEEVELVQVQCITSRYKPRTFFMKMKSEKVYKYILKGPFVKVEDMNEIILSDELKVKFGLFSPKAKRVSFNGDNRYLLSINYALVIDPVETITRTTKLETNVKIFNGSTSVYPNKTPLTNFSNELQLEVLKCLAFRKIIGTNDTCQRNLVINESNGQCCSIDDPALFTQTACVWKKPITNQQMKNGFRTSLKNNWNEVVSFIGHIVEVLDEDETIDEEQKEFMFDKCDELSEMKNWTW